MNRKLTSLALASLGILALALPTVSHAYVMATAVQQVSNFRLLDSSGAILDATGANTATPTGDFRSLTFTTSADQSVSLTGSGGGTASNSGTSAVGSINFAPICVGSGCNPILPADSFPKLVAPPSTGNYAAADQLESGAPVTGIAGFGSPATVSVGSFVGIDTNSAVGSTDANNNLNSSFTFVPNFNDTVTLSFDAFAWLQVAVTSDEAFPGFATAATTLSFSLVNLGTGATVFSYSPNFFGDGVNTLSLNAPLPIDIQNCRGTGGVSTSCNPLTHSFVNFTATTPILTAGNLYQFSARQTSNADAQRQAVPEPGILALVGMGLVGLGLTRRRRQAA